jgi:glyoxylase-like metal-dependent hydrolase (beta-lactamase superfamily II)
VNRRDFLRSAAAVALFAQQPTITSRNIVNGFGLMNVGGNNVLYWPNPRGTILVDSGPANYAAEVREAINGIGGSRKVQILFNTHYHADQTGNNELFVADNPRVIAHAHTRQWMSMDHWIPNEDRYEKARPKPALPTETFYTTGSLTVGNEEIEYGHLPLAHTDGDIYVFFKTTNVLAVGDVASPLRDPSLDWFTGAWIGGRVDAMDTILKVSNDQTRIVPATGFVMSRAEFKEERDMMEEVRSRIWKHTLQGESPKEMLEAGVMTGLARDWKDPYKFLYDAAKGMFAHHNKLDPAMN